MEVGEMVEKKGKGKKEKGKRKTVGGRGCRTPIRPYLPSYL